MPEVLTRPAAMQRWSDDQRRVGRRIAVVPTMGALHEGHRALIRTARDLADRVIVTLFVNPLQFNERADFDSYPRPIDTDVATCETEGVHAVYAPTGAVMYPDGFQTHVEPGELADRLEGPMRPGHFRGVTTVVTKLFGATRPHLAVFGEKDFQQLAIVRRMTADLDLGVEVVGVPIVREPDGLALSSRNVRLSAAERRAAVVLSRALDEAAMRFCEGTTDATSLASLVASTIAGEPLAALEYVEVVDTASLTPVASVESGRAVILLAAWFGDVRLIDNRVLSI